MKYLILVLLFSIPLLTKEKSCIHSSTEFQCVKFIKNYDGDTVTFEIPNVHPIIGKNISIRISGIDTPEMKTKNPCEKNKAVAAKKVVENLLKGAKRIHIKNIKRGKYFRIVGDVIADGVDIKSVLLQKKLAYEYSGGNKIKVNWCDTSKRGIAND
jgi:micrococcal nuclease